MFELFDVDGYGSIDRKEMVDIFKCALKMTEEDVNADFHAEKITADIFERFDRDENNSLTKNEFHTAFFKQHKSFGKFPTLYSLTFGFQTE